MAPILDSRLQDMLPDLKEVVATFAGSDVAQRRQQRAEAERVLALLKDRGLPNAASPSVDVSSASFSVACFVPSLNLSLSLFLSLSLSLSVSVYSSLRLGQTPRL